jgi:hypothetical protein
MPERAYPREYFTALYCGPGPLVPSRIDERRIVGRPRAAQAADMKELATDIAIVLGPAAGAYYLMGDPWISALWIIVGLTVRWYQRHWQEPPYGNGDEGAGDARQ